MSCWEVKRGKGGGGEWRLFFFLSPFSHLSPYLRQVLVDGVQCVGLFPGGEKRRGVPALDALRRGGVLCKSVQGEKRENGKDEGGGARRYALALCSSEKMIVFAPKLSN